MKKTTYTPIITYKNDISMLKYIYFRGNSTASRESIVNSTFRKTTSLHLVFNSRLRNLMFYHIIIVGNNSYQKYILYTKEKMISHNIIFFFFILIYSVISPAKLVEKYFLISDKSLV